MINCRIAKFINRLYTILDEPLYQKIIKWNDLGDTFIIEDMTNFVNKILLKHFNHNNFASFTRLLNLYGFHKLKSSCNEYVFKHALFSKYNKNKFHLIVRKNSLKGKLINSSLPLKSKLFSDSYDNLFRLINRQKELENIIEGLLKANEGNIIEIQKLTDQVKEKR